MPYAIIEKHTHPKHPRLVFLLTSQSQNFLARTYLNGKLIADIQDKQALKGRFGIQHHGKGGTVRFRKMRMRALK